MAKPNRNDACPCGSGKKYKKCCIANESVAATTQATPRPAAAAMTPLEQKLIKGIKLHEAGEFDRAADVYRQILRVDPEHPYALHALGMFAREKGDTERAVKLLRRAISNNPREPRFHVNLGTTLMSCGELEEAMDCYRYAANLKPEIPEAFLNLAKGFRLTGEIEESIRYYRRAVAAKPDYYEAHDELGETLLSRGKIEAAVRHLQSALDVKPDYAPAHFHLGHLFTSQRKHEEATNCYRRAFELDPEMHGALHQLGVSLYLGGYYEDAMQAFRDAFDRDQSVANRLKVELTLPIINDSVEHITEVRQKLEANLDALIADPPHINDPISEIGVTHTYLAYHGCDNRNLQEKFSRFFRAACPTLNFTAPHCLEPREPESGEKIKIGFVSQLFREGHIITRFSEGLISQLSRDDFAVTLFHTMELPKQISDALTHPDDAAILLPTDLTHAQRIVSDQKLDVLFYFDIGMDPFTYFLAHARLARVQCVTNGHPDTTGISTLDHYMSTAWYEPENAQQHYSERLASLPVIPTYFRRSPAPANFPPRSHFGFQDGQHIYLCPMTPFKFHPELDDMLAEILRADPDGQLVMVETYRPLNAALIDRLKSKMPDVSERISFVERQTAGADFLSLLNAADVVLDTLHFGGGTTYYEALAVGAPVVTLPGEHARGRMGQGMYSRIGVMDCVARDKQDYVRIALRLGNDPAFRKEVRAKILANCSVLYEDGEAMAVVNKFLIEAARGA